MSTPIQQTKTPSFAKATKKAAKLRLALNGPSGSGKTYTSLKVASNLGGRIAVIDTERGSASKYADEFNFDVLELESFHPTEYVNAIKAAEGDGYEILIIDSLTHAWTGKDGVLDLHERAVARQKTKNSYTAWAEVTPLHQSLIDAMVGSRCHVIATMRTKTEYSQEKDQNGKTVVRKIGTAPVQRDGVEYEFDVVADLTIENELIITKTRCSALQGAVVKKAGAEVAATLKGWLEGGAAGPETARTAPAAASEAERLEKARKLVFINAVQKTEDGNYVVTEAAGAFEVYKTNRGIECSCPDYQKDAALDPKYKCVHKLAVGEHNTLKAELDARAAQEQAR